jgi:acylpyruvate hydrolase
MRYVAIDDKGYPTAGVIVGDEVLNLKASSTRVGEARPVPNGVREILFGGDRVATTVKKILDLVSGKDDLRADLQEIGALKPLAQSKLMAPIPQPTLILSCGMNYHEHLREMNTPVPKTPTAFTKNAASVIGPGEAIVLPKMAPDMVDWEGEFSLVIGRPCFGVEASDALNYVAGYTIINDVSARNWVAPIFQAQGTMPSILAWEHNILGKQFPTFCPMGPMIVTADEVGDVSDLHLETRLNGQVMQSTSSSDLVFDVSKLIEYFSQFYRLMPGDIITTGSPSGVGYGRNPKIFMKPGDIIEVEVECVGCLTNPIAGDHATNV